MAQSLLGRALSRLGWLCGWQPLVPWDVWLYPLPILRMNTLRQGRGAPSFLTAGVHWSSFVLGSDGQGLTVAILLIS